MDIVDLRLSSDYRSSAADTTDHDPPLAFYNSTQDTTVTDETMIWRLHARRLRLRSQFIHRVETYARTVR